MRQLVRRSRRAGWPIEGTLWRCPGQARRRACCVPLAVACGAAPLQPRKRRAQIQEAAHLAAECCTGLQRRLWRCGVVSPPCPRSRRAAARPSTSCRRCAPRSGSTGCSLRIRSFAQRSVRATPRKADPQSAREAVCGRPGKHAPATSGERATKCFYSGAVFFRPAWLVYGSWRANSLAVLGSRCADYGRAKRERQCRAREIGPIGKAECIDRFRTAGM